MKPLTARQAEVLAVIHAYRDTHGVPPSFGAVARALNVKCAVSVIEALANKHRIQIGRGGIELPRTQGTS